MARPPPGALPPAIEWIASLARTVEHATIAFVLRGHVSGAAPLPAAHDLGPIPPRKDQGQSSSCTAHSLSVAIALACASAGAPCVDPSPHVLYSLSGRPVPLADNGRLLQDVWDAAAAFGLAPQKGPAPDGRNSDVTSPVDVPDHVELANVNVDATDEEIAEAAKCRPKLSLSTINPFAQNVELQVQAALVAGQPLWVSALVGGAFQSLTQGQDAQPASQGPGSGYHALVIAGYRTRNGVVEYRVINSWGEAWDEQGECWASGAWLRACAEIHAIGVSA
jgi:hypothetical protein